MGDLIKYIVIIGSSIISFSLETYRKALPRIHDFWEKEDVNKAKIYLENFRT